MPVELTPAGLCGQSRCIAPAFFWYKISMIANLGAKRFMLKNIILLILINFYSVYVSAEIYKWVDEQGNINYGDKPVVDSNEVQVDVTDKGNVKISDTREKNRQKLLDAYNQDQSRENKEKEKQKKQKKKRQRDCAQAKDYMRTYDRARSLYSLDKEGNRVTLSDKERKKSTAELKKYIKKNCK